MGPQMTLEWAGPASLSVALSGTAENGSAYGVLDFRASENFISPLQPPTEDVVNATLTDADGKSRTVATSAYSDSSPSQELRPASRYSTACAFRSAISVESTSVTSNRCG
jgi:hypothetical protein